MDFGRLVVTAEFVVVVLAVISGLILAVVFFRAWLRSRKGAFLLLCTATIANVYVNIFTGAVLLFGVAHIRVIPIAAFDPLYAAQAVFGGFATVAFFVGTLFLVRLALTACSPKTPNQALERTASPSDV